MATHCTLAGSSNKGATLWKTIFFQINQFWDDSNKKKNYNWLPTRCQIFTLWPPLSLPQLILINQILGMNDCLRNSQGILWSKVWNLKIYSESSLGQPVWSDTAQIHLPVLKRSGAWNLVINGSMYHFHTRTQDTCTLAGSSSKGPAHWKTNFLKFVILE